MEMDRNTLQHTDVGLPTGNMFEQVRSKIMTVRETVVILDADIADLYGVETKRVNEAVKNNPDKFPSTSLVAILIIVRTLSEHICLLNGERRLVYQ